MLSREVVINARSLRANCWDVANFEVLKKIKIEVFRWFNPNPRIPSGLDKTRPALAVVSNT
jgi:hypothetical protein